MTVALKLSVGRLRSRASADYQRLTLYLLLTVRIFPFGRSGGITTDGRICVML